MAGFATKLKVVLLLPTGSPLGRGIQLSEQMERQPGHGLPGSQWGPPSPSFHLFSLLPSLLAPLPPCRSSITPLPAPTSSRCCHLAGGLLCLHTLAPTWQRLGAAAAAVQVSSWSGPQRGGRVCVQSRDDGADCNGRPRSTLPHGNLPKKQQLYHLPTRGPPP